MKCLQARMAATLPPAGTQEPPQRQKAAKTRCMSCSPLLAPRNAPADLEDLLPEHGRAEQREAVHELLVLAARVPAAPDLLERVEAEPHEGLLGPARGASCEGCVLRPQEPAVRPSRLEWLRSLAGRGLPLSWWTLSSGSVWQLSSAYRCRRMPADLGPTTRPGAGVRP